ncbi:MAG: type II secretion system F family protein [Proteobacteria bacterium]|nr:type II secretion system F family protein [Pseudomonadota bacterium]
MAQFEYKAIAPGGEVVLGEIAADSREAAIGGLRRKGVVPLRVAEARSSGGRRVFASLKRRKPNVKDLMLFTRELAILLAAGIALDRALATLDRIVVDGPMQGLPGQVLDEVKGGASLADALASRGDVFPAFYVGMVRAGEAGGSQVLVLERLADMLERSEALKANIRSALLYPLLVLIITGVSLVVLLVFVIPEFRPIFEDAGAELPLTTRIVIAFSDFAVEWGWLLLIALLAALLALRRFSLSEAGRLRLDRWLLGAPLLGELVRRIETARFCRSLGTLRANGVTLIDAVGIAAGTLGNRAVSEAARQTIGPLAKGEGLSTPMRRTGCFPPLALQLIEVGEESGKLADMLLQVADVYDKEVERSIERLLALLAPLVTILLGFLIAFIIGSILAAILGTYDIAL